MRSHRLPEKLIQIRTALHLTQEALIEAMGFEGEIRQSNISSYEIGRNDPPFPVLVAYAELAGIWVDYLIDDRLDLPAKLPGKLRNSLK